MRPSVDDPAPADRAVATPPPIDPAVRRADARRHRGSVSMLAAPLRHVESAARLRHAYAAAEKADYDQAIAECHEAIRLDPRDGLSCACLATVLASHLERKDRDGKNAVELAKRGCERTGWTMAYAPDALAAANAEVGDFDAAVRRQARAVAMQPDREEKLKSEVRLKMYQARTPYRMTGPGRGPERQGGRSYVASDGGRGGAGPGPDGDGPGR